jgi:ubiquinone/menaquinone biosynthesis C-methylase UbiE
LEALCSLLPTKWRVLDVGTGTGFLLPLLSTQFSRVIAVDPSPAMLKLAQKRAQRENCPGIRFRHGHLENLPVESSSIDLALAILVLHHSEDLELALRELYRVLQPEGKLLVVDLLPHHDETFQRVMGDPVRGVVPEQLRQTLDRAGFETTLERRLQLEEAGKPGGPEQDSPGLFLRVAEKKD